ncbi:unnamed protein product [Dicrocoelium dendriticum]|nr:unnamed protein product [Dicrocoelium dendriticum]
MQTLYIHTRDTTETRPPNTPKLLTQPQTVDPGRGKQQRATEDLTPTIPVRRGTRNTTHLDPSTQNDRLASGGDDNRPRLTGQPTGYSKDDEQLREVEVLPPKGLRNYHLLHGMSNQRALPNSLQISDTELLWVNSSRERLTACPDPLNCGTLDYHVR